MDRLFKKSTNLISHNDSQSRLAIHHQINDQPFNGYIKARTKLLKSGSLTEFRLQIAVTCWPTTCIS